MTLQEFMKANLRLHMKEPQALSSLSETEILHSYLCLPAPAVTFEEWMATLIALSGHAPEETLPERKPATKEEIDALERDPGLKGIVKVTRRPKQ